MDTSDYTIEDWVNEFDKPLYFKVYDTRECRNCVFEFNTMAKMEEFVAKYNNFQANDSGATITAEIFEVQRRGGRNNRFVLADEYSRGGRSRASRGPEGSRGSHYGSSSRAQRNDTRVPDKAKTAEELDAELDAYMNS